MTLPSKYESMSDEQLVAAIRRAKRLLGDALVILVHHYQRDEVIQFADFRGDSLGLSRRAAAVESAKYIVFCGVYFMAETAAVLCKPDQLVIQPVEEALCPMAQMANADVVSQAWDALSTVWGADMIPITYQNSTAPVKAFVGQHGGAVCTSSNAGRLFDWAFHRKKHILFMPDEHLGTNTALAMGIPREEIGIWDPAHPPEPQTLAHCRVVVWKGHCYVHNGFTVQDVEIKRQSHPDAVVAVHPECTPKVVAQADISGSTTGIIRAVEEAPVGSTIVVGTEYHLVNRLDWQHPGKTVVPLSPRVCKTMAMTRIKHLSYVLDSILDGSPRHIVTVDDEIARWARVALERMLEAS
jgi:quinolinate synthase